MKQTLYIIRGLTGSGKSTLADSIVAGTKVLGEVNQTIKVEVEQFFTTNNGHKEIYKFDRRFLGAAHDECYGRVMRHLRAGVSVAVANTFSTDREVQRYLSGLQRTGLADKVTVQIIKCVGKYKSPHNIPARAVDKMRQRWEDVSGEVIFDGELNV